MPTPPNGSRGIVCRYCGDCWTCDEVNGCDTNNGCDCRNKRNNHLIRVHDIIPEGASAHNDTDERLDSYE